MTNFFTHHGLPLVAGVVMIESFAAAITRYGLVAALGVAAVVAVSWLVADRARGHVEHRL